VINNLINEMYEEKNEKFSSGIRIYLGLVVIDVGVLGLD
jgi:hypothetical protein